MQREEELKYRLAGRQDFEKLRSLLGKPDKEVHQRNFYFDTEKAALQRRGMLFRLRFESPPMEALLTLKRALSVEAGRIVAQEEEVVLTERQVKELEEDPLGFLVKLNLKICNAILSACEGSEVKKIAELRTHRRTYCLPEGELSLDLVEYCGIQEWELELETENAKRAVQFLSDLFRKAAVVAEPEAEPKSMRLFKRLGVLGEESRR